jgi:hypothetical protein
MVPLSGGVGHGCTKIAKEVSAEPITTCCECKAEARLRVAIAALDQIVANGPPNWVPFTIEDVSEALRHPLRIAETALAKIRGEHTMTIDQMDPVTKAQLHALESTTKVELTAWLRNQMTPIICNADLIVVGASADVQESAAAVTKAGREFLKKFESLIQ